MLGFKEITAPTNERTFIAALLPVAGFGNKLPLLNPATSERREYLLCANLNSVVFDFVTRQKIQGQTLNLFIVEQLPVIPSQAYQRKFGPRTAADIVRDEVLALSYTAHDMAAFARDMGFDGPLFTWDAFERAHRRAKLDALYFLLYGATGRDDVEYIFSTFPIVAREDAKAWGLYPSRDLCPAYMNALEAGDPGARIDPL